MAGRASLGRLRVEKGQGSRLRIDSEGADRGLVFIDRVEKGFVRVKGEERRIAGFHGQGRWREGPVREVQFALVDALAVSLAVGAEVDTKLILGRS